MENKMAQLRRIARQNPTKRVAECIKRWGETFFRIAKIVIDSKPRISAYNAMIAIPNLIGLMNTFGKKSLPALADAIQETTIQWVAQYDPDSAQMKLALNRRIDDSTFSGRVTNFCERVGVVYIGDLVQWREEDVRKQKGLGRKSIFDINDNLEPIGLSLGMQLDGWERPTE